MTVAAVSNVSNAVYLGALLIDSLHTLRFLLFNSILPRERDRNRRTWQTLSALLHRLNRPVACCSALSCANIDCPTIHRHSLVCIISHADTLSTDLHFHSSFSPVCLPPSLPRSFIHTDLQRWFIEDCFWACALETHTRTHKHTFLQTCLVYVRFLFFSSTLLFSDWKGRSGRQSALKMCKCLGRSIDRWTQLGVVQGKRIVKPNI